MSDNGQNMNEKTDTLVELVI